MRLSLPAPLPRSAPAGRSARNRPTISANRSGFVTDAEVPRAGQHHVTRALDQPKYCSVVSDWHDAIEAGLAGDDERRGGHATAIALEVDGEPGAHPLGHPRRRHRRASAPGRRTRRSSAHRAATRAARARARAAACSRRATRTAAAQPRPFQVGRPARIRPPARRRGRHQHERTHAIGPTGRVSHRR